MNRYMNQHGYSDVFPFEVVREVSPKCVEVRPMDYQMDPAFEPQIVLGGFLGHCVNNNEQRYFYAPRPDQASVYVRLRKDGRWYDRDGQRYVPADEPRRFYDFNF
jgi:hypothetical protein